MFPTDDNRRILVKTVPSEPTSGSPIIAWSIVAFPQIPGTPVITAVLETDASTVLRLKPTGGQAIYSCQSGHPCGDDKTSSTLLALDCSTARGSNEPTRPR
jgi:hypothetical protein